MLGCGLNAIMRERWGLLGWTRGLTLCVSQSARKAAECWDGASFSCHATCGQGILVCLGSPRPISRHISGRRGVKNLCVDTSGSASAPRHQPRMACLQAATECSYPIKQLQNLYPGEERRPPPLAAAATVLTAGVLPHLKARAAWVQGKHLLCCILARQPCACPACPARQAWMRARMQTCCWTPCDAARALHATLPGVLL